MPALCLSRSELAELCRTPQRARQCAFLRANGIRHYVDAYGWPVVLRSAVEDRPDEAVRDTWKPNKAA
ncbi:MAG: DUF4224 domain-containing protein [Xanthomonadaceae bacterium]|nr:DUF4224 domain-containing protein [Xanthomonadaceae bacterium]